MTKKSASAPQQNPSTTLVKDQYHASLEKENENFRKDNHTLMQRCEELEKCLKLDKAKFSPSELAERVKKGYGEQVNAQKVVSERLYENAIMLLDYADMWTPDHPYDYDLTHKHYSIRIVHDIDRQYVDIEIEHAQDSVNFNWQERYEMNTPQGKTLVEKSKRVWMYHRTQGPAFGKFLNYICKEITLEEAKKAAEEKEPDTK